MSWRRIMPDERILRAGLGRLRERTNASRDAERIFRCVSLLRAARVGAAVPLRHANIVGLHLNPPDSPRPVRRREGVDPSLRPHPAGLVAAPRQAKRQTHDYTRPGRTSLFAELNAARGKVIGGFHQRPGPWNFASARIEKDGAQ